MKLTIATLTTATFLASTASAMIGPMSADSRAAAHDAYGFVAHEAERAVDAAYRGLDGLSLEAHLHDQNTGDLPEGFSSPKAPNKLN